jgi:hypothetical protein
MGMEISGAALRRVLKGFSGKVDLTGMGATVDSRLHNNFGARWRLVKGASLVLFTLLVALAETVIVAMVFGSEAGREPGASTFSSAGAGPAEGNGAKGRELGATASASLSLEEEDTKAAASGLSARAFGTVALLGASLERARRLPEAALELLGCCGSSGREETWAAEEAWVEPTGDGAGGLRALRWDLRVEASAELARSRVLSGATGAEAGFGDLVRGAGAGPEAGWRELSAFEIADCPRFTASSKISLRTASGGAGRFDMREGVVDFTVKFT